MCKNIILFSYDSISQSLRWYHFLCDLSGFVVSCFTWWNHRPLECGFAPFRWTCVVPQLEHGWKSMIGSLEPTKQPAKNISCTAFVWFCMVLYGFVWLCLCFYVMGFRTGLHSDSHLLKHFPKILPAKEAGVGSSQADEVQSIWKWLVVVDVVHVVDVVFVGKKNGTALHKSWVPSQQELQ